MQQSVLIHSDNLVALNTFWTGFKGQTATTNSLWSKTYDSCSSLVFHATAGNATIAYGKTESNKCKITSSFIHSDNIVAPLTFIINLIDHYNYLKYK